ncbi:hypothetical protein ROT00_07460 [Agromyces mediolanus]|uniref:hypothetical protein n=1 Tax=Agromyces mediolanus TaxID=41986 RepID=UPI0038370225
MNLDDFWANAIWSLAPSIGIGLIFWFVIRAVVRADRGERKAYARMEQKLRTERAQERQKTAAAPKEAPGDG